MEQLVSNTTGRIKININFQTNQIKLIIDENEQLFEGIFINKHYADIPYLASRICSNCSFSHNLASIMAIENAFQIKINPINKKLRELILYSQIVQSHTLHIYFFSIKDYFNTPDFLSLAQTNPETFNDIVKLKTNIDYILNIVSGGNIHPVTTTVGGFSKIPSISSLKKMLSCSKDALKSAKRLAKIYTCANYPNLQKATTYLSLTSQRGYPTISDVIESSSGETFTTKNYTKKIIEHITDSPVKNSYYKNKEFVTGALARLSLHANRLAPQAKKIHLKSINKFSSFPAYNSYHNYYAQSIEIIHFLENIIDALTQLSNTSNYKFYPVKSFETKKSEGRIVIESPRGLLYHYYQLDKNGIIKNCNIIDSSSQSLNNLESDIKVLLDQTSKLDNITRLELIKMLIRAYDLCTDCCVH